MSVIATRVLIHDEQVDDVEEFFSKLFDVFHEYLMEDKGGCVYSLLECALVNIQMLDGNAGVVLVTDGVAV